MGMQKSGMAAFERKARNAVDTLKVPCVVAMSGNAERKLYEFAYGDSGIAGRAAIAADDVIYIASMTKAITSFAAVQLIERGRLKLEQPASDILPELARHEVLTGFSPDGKPQTRKPSRPVTVRHLLTHTAGYSTDVWNAAILRYTQVMGTPGMPTCLNAALEVPLVFDPGDRWEYSIAIDWIGKIVEKLSGQRLEEYFRERIFAPLGMDWTSFIISPRQRQKLVPVRRKDEAGTAWVPTGFEISQTPEFYMGGAGLYGTADDYLRFLRMLLNGGALDGKRVAKPETVALFLANHTGDVEVPVLASVMPALSADLDLLPGKPKKWSLGFMRNETDVPGGRSAGGQFWAGLASSYCWLDPKQNLAGLAMMSYFPFADAEGLAVFDALEQATYATFG